MHKSVLLNESINYLNVKSDGVYVDATMGYGGHSNKILEKNKKGKLYCFDKDPFAINYCKEKFKQNDNVIIIKSDFKFIKDKLEDYKVYKVDGVLYDLGVSSVQLDNADRGFSFHKDAPLDMRMDTDKGFNAYDVINTYSLDELIRIFRDYGEERYASSIASKIVLYRETKKIETTLELVDIIRSGMPAKALRESHPARKVFQAIRIEVNDELTAIKDSLISSLELLNVGGRICVITFHSLEEKIVKSIFKEYSSVPSEIAKLPFIPEEYKPKYKIVAKKVVPTDEEIENNKRARSAKLFVIEKVGE